MNLHLSVAPPRRVSDPGAPRLRADVTAILLAAVGGAVATAWAAGDAWVEVAAIGAAIVVAELLAVRLADGTQLPLSYALAFPLSVVTAPAPAAATVCAATLLAAFAQRERPALDRARSVFERTLAAMSVVAVVQAVPGVLPMTDTGSRLVSLLAGALALLVVELGLRHARGDGSFRAARGHGALFAVAASGVLMGAGYLGSDTGPAMGAWGLGVFAVPALAARWAYGRLHAIGRTYDQTIRVLSVIPEMGGRVKPGHSERVRELCLEVGRIMGLSRLALDDLERAALLHALGHVTLDDSPPTGGAPTVTREVAGATVGVLEDGITLARPAGIVARMADVSIPVPPGPETSLADAEERLAAEVLKAVTAYEDLAGGDPTLARPALQYVASARGCVDDRRVVAALARAVTRQGLAVSA